MDTSSISSHLPNMSSPIEIVLKEQDMDWQVSRVELGNSSENFSQQEEDSFYETYSWSADFMMRYSPAISSVYCIAYTIVFAMGIIGNSCVVAVVLRSPRMRTVTNYFIVNLALADILVLLFCLPATLLSNLFIRKSRIPFSVPLGLQFDKRCISGAVFASVTLKGSICRY